MSVLRPSCILRAADFKQKSRWSAVWPNMHYGAMYLNYSVGRQLPMRSVNWVTRDCNRLTNFSDRYESVIRDIDVKRTEEELKIPLSDIRWNDHRRIYWRCSFCGSSYRKNVSVRVKYHAGCNYCKGRFSSEVLREQADQDRPTLGSTHPALVKELSVSYVTAAAAGEGDSAPEGTGDDAGSHNPASSSEGKQNTQAEEIRGNLSQLSPTSKFRAEWRCEGCGGLYRASIRSRTGEVAEGQAALHPAITSWSAYCPSCRWEKNLTPLGQKILKDGHYLGLNLDDAEED